MPRTRERLSLRSLEDEAQADRFIPASVPWVHEAWQPYADWFFGGASQARGAITRWMARPSSEISIKRVTLAFSGEQPAGGFVALDGAALDRCVRADTIATLKEVDRAERAAFLARSAALSDLERPRVEPDQFFLSKVGVLPEFRGTGYGRALCERFLAIGSAAGFERFRLDVSPTNVPAVRLYESLGFRVVADAASEQTGIRALSMVLERLRQRDG